MLSLEEKKGTAVVTNVSLLIHSTNGPILKDLLKLKGVWQQVASGIILRCINKAHCSGGQRQTLDIRLTQYSAV